MNSLTNSKSRECTSKGLGAAHVAEQARLVCLKPLVNQLDSEQNETTRWGMQLNTKGHR